MSKRCASCGDFNPRRSKTAPGDWAGYLTSERDVSSVGRLVLPLCRDCYAEAESLPETSDGESREFLDGLDTSALVDDVQG